MGQLVSRNYHCQTPSHGTTISSRMGQYQSRVEDLKCLFSTIFAHDCDTDKDAIYLVATDPSMTNALLTLKRELFDVDVQASREIIKKVSKFYIIYAKIILHKKTYFKNGYNTEVEKLLDLRQQIRLLCSQYVVQLDTLNKQKWFIGMLGDIECALLSCCVAVHNKHDLKQAVSMYRPCANPVCSIAYGAF